MHTLLFYDPGHFHAALTLRNENPRVATDVYVYAHSGPDRQSFVDLVEAFNSRASNPTRWRVHLCEADDPLGRLIEERRGDIVVLAGRNAGKLASIAHLHQAGFHVLADKPWLISSTALADLRRATAGLPLAMDIMTERYEVLARLRQRIVSNKSVFGEFQMNAGQAAIEIASVHHLYKVVNGRPLTRPAWYYDVRIQGDGLVDIQSHLADQVDWMVLGDDPREREIHVHAARRWATAVPLDLYRESTGLEAFPAALDEDIDDGVLALACNGEIEYSLNGVQVRQRAEWGQREPPGTGDLHPSVIRGTRCRVLVRHGHETDRVAQLHLIPTAGADIEAALAGAITEWQEDFPGIGMDCENAGFTLTVPDALRTTHESHFAMVLEQFLDHVDSGRWPDRLAARIRARYELLGRARELALE